MDNIKFCFWSPIRSQAGGIPFPAIAVRVALVVEMDCLEQRTDRLPIILIYNEGHIMLRWSITFLIIAIIAAVLGFGGIAGAAAGIAEILFYVFIVLFVISLIFRRK